MTTHKCLLWTVASSLTSRAEAMLINTDHYRLRKKAAQKFKTAHYLFPDFVIGATLHLVAGSSKDLRRSDSCFDPWINFPASAIKRTVFVFSSSILRRNNEDSSSILRRNMEDSSSCCELAMPCILLRSIWVASDAEFIRLHKRPTPGTGHGGGMCKGTSTV
jgi:hypothetical protein